MSTNKDKASGMKIALIAIIVVLVIVLIVGGVVIFKLLNKPQAVEDKGSTVGRGTVATKDTAESVMQDLENVPVEDGYFKTAQTIDWHFKDGVSEDAYVGNSEDNGRTVYFDLTLEDTGEVIYSSPFIPVGSELDGLELDKKLDAGTYETIMIYHLVDDNNEDVSTLSVALTIYVE